MAAEAIVIVLKWDIPQDRARCFKLLALTHSHLFFLPSGFGMDFTSPLKPEDVHTLRTISRHDEINEWLSAKVDIRITQTAISGFGTVYCVAIYLISLTFSCKNVALER